MADAKLTQVYILFNFFEKVPSNYIEGMKYLCGWMSKDKETEEGLLLKNVEQDDKWKYMNYAMINTDDYIVFKPKPELEGNQTDLSAGVPLPGEEGPTPGAVFGAKVQEAFKEGVKDIVAHPGGFEEFASYSAVDSSIPVLPKKPTNLDTTGFMMVPFPNSGGCSFTEENWLEESGAKFVKENAPPKLSLRRITLHKRFTRDGDFSHVLLCEFTEALSHAADAKEFVGKFCELKKGDSPALMKVAMPYWSAA